MQQLRLEEVLVLRALSRRAAVDGFSRVRMQSMSREMISQIVGELGRLGLITARATENGEWLAGPLTSEGKAWVKAYDERTPEDRQKS